MRGLAALFAVLLPVAGPAAAASSAWYDTEGGRVRLVTAAAPGADGVLRGALEIALAPGWKTYWRDPGDAGVPPSLDISSSTNVAAAELAFPAPERHDDGYAVWAGYDRPVALPVSFTVGDTSRTAAINAAVFLGICQSICVPVSTTLTVDTSQGADDAEAAVVAAAFDALPRPADAAFGVTGAALAGETLSVTVALPPGVDRSELYVAGADGYMLGLPEPQAGTGTATFTVPVYDKPEAKPAGAGLPYTLVAGDKAVSGVLPYP